MRFSSLLCIFLIIVSARSLSGQTTTASHLNIWRIDSGPIDPAHYASATVSNGMVSMVSSPEPFAVKDVLMAGLYDLHPGEREKVTGLVKCYKLGQMSLSINGTDVASADAAKNIRNFHQILDLKHANLTTQFDYGDKAHVSYTWYALRQLPFTTLVDMTVTAAQPIEIRPASFMVPSDELRDVEYYPGSHAPGLGDSKLLTSTARTPTGRILLAASTGFLFDRSAGDSPHVVHGGRSDRIHTIAFSQTLPAGVTYHFAVVGSLQSSSQDDDPLNSAERITEFAAMQGAQRLITSHTVAWDELWKSDILIEGDDATQRDLHSMLYYLYSCTRAGSSWSPGPTCLTSPGWYGHVFWDSETWMYPVLLLMHPEIAESMLEYRFERLDAAKRNAASYGYRGAMFPWESAETGSEQTGRFNSNAQLEIHITADIAIAVWQYFCVTHDRAWLKEKGWPILKATSDFWASRVERNGPGHYDLKGVTGACEGRSGVDNNTFTNAAARENLRVAIEAAKILDLEPDRDWKTVRDNIPILHFDNGITRQDASYTGESRDADTLLAEYPLHEITDAKQIRADVEYYEPRVWDGPQTSTIVATLYARLGMPEKAYEVFEKSYVPALQPPFGSMGHAVYFATGGGGVLQTAMYGFAGLDITDKGIVQLPAKLPPAWKTLTLTGIGPEKRSFVVHGTAQ